MPEEQIMNIAVIQKDFRGEKVRFVNARELYKKLSVGTKFADWIGKRIKEYGFEYGTDYISIPDKDQLNSEVFDFSNFGNQKEKAKSTKGRGGDRRTVEYVITIDMAKELCMVENNDIGKAIRKYFIKTEQEFRKIIQIAYQNPKFINQLSQSYVEARDDGKDYRKEFTDSIRDYVDDKHYAIYTDMIYEFLFEERAGEYRELLSLSEKDATRDTMYSEILVIVGSIEAGFAEELQIRFDEKKQKLKKDEVIAIFKEYINRNHWKVYKKNAMRIMVTYDEELRGITHKRMIDYKKDFTQEDIQKLLGK